MFNQRYDYVLWQKKLHVFYSRFNSLCLCNKATWAQFIVYKLYSFRDLYRCTYKNSPKTHHDRKNARNIYGRKKETLILMCKILLRDLYLKIKMTYDSIFSSLIPFFIPEGIKLYNDIRQPLKIFYFISILDRLFALQVLTYLPSAH